MHCKIMNNPNCTLVLYHPYLIITLPGQSKFTAILLSSWLIYIHPPNRGLLFNFVSIIIERPYLTFD